MSHLLDLGLSPLVPHHLVVVELLLAPWLGGVSLLIRGYRMLHHIVVVDRGVDVGVDAIGWLLGQELVVHHNRLREHGHGVTTRCEPLHTLQLHFGLDPFLEDVLEFVVDHLFVVTSSLLELLHRRDSKLLELLLHDQVELIPDLVLKFALLCLVYGLDAAFDPLSRF